MSDLEGSYAPQSPDLSEYQTYQPEPSPSSFGHFACVPPTNYTPQPPYLHNQQHLARPSYTSSPAQMPRRIRTTDSEGTDGDFVPGASTPSGRGRKPKKPKVEVEEKIEKPAPGVEEGIEVKTKFPVARIKRIMQADEDVGKVAQVTPTAVSKALELFMISIVTKAADQAKTKQAKKVTAAHLKQVVSDVEAFDFLKDIVSKVADAPAAKKDDDSEEGADAKKRKKTRVRRKVKSEDED